MAGQVALEGIGQVRVNVKDVTRAVGFYRDVLGMTLLFEVPEQRMAFFDCGGVRLYLGEEESAAETAPIYYRVRGLDGAYETLRARGVEFVEPPHTVYRLEHVEGRMAFLTDSEGNTVGLMEETPITPGPGAASAP